MRIRLLNAAGARQLYESRMARDFPPGELKPFAAVEELLAAGLYEPLTFTDDAGAVLAYAWQVVLPGQQAGLVDYFAVRSDLRGSGIGIALENDFEYRSAPYQRIFCANVHELVELVDSFNDPKHVGVCYDFGHGNLGGPFHRQNLNIIGSRLHVIHVQDNHGMSDEHLLPFHGNINWQEAMEGLADIDYDGDLTYEIQEFGRYFPNDQKHLVVEY